MEKKVLPWKAGLDRKFANVLILGRHKGLGMEYSGRQTDKRRRRKGD